MICFLVFVLEMALPRKVVALGEGVPYDDLLSDLSELKEVEYTSTAGAASPGRTLPVRPTSLSARSV